MSVQTTQIITREEAERRLIYKRTEEERERLRKSVIGSMTNEEIEDELESTFDNYIIKENP